MKLLRRLSVTLLTITLLGCGTDTSTQIGIDDIQLNCIVYQLTPEDYSYEDSSDNVYFIALTSNENIEIAEDPFLTINDSYIKMKEGFTKKLLKDKIENPNIVYERYIHTNDTINSIRYMIQNMEILVRIDNKSVQKKVTVIQELE